MSWKLEKISTSVYRISRGRDRAGHVLFKDGGYRAKITVGDQTVEAVDHTAGDAFREVVAQANRILICGQNNRELAAATLVQRADRHNESVRKMADELNWIADQCGTPRVAIVTRRRRRRPLI